MIQSLLQQLDIMCIGTRKNDRQRKSLLIYQNTALCPHFFLGLLDFSQQTPKPEVLLPYSRPNFATPSRFLPVHRTVPDLLPIFIPYFGIGSNGLIKHSFSKCELLVIRSLPNSLKIVLSPKNKFSAKSFPNPRPPFPSKLKPNHVCFTSENKYHDDNIPYSISNTSIPCPKANGFM